MTPKAVDPGSSWLPPCLPPAGPSAFLFLTMHWGAVEEGVPHIYPLQSTRVRGILTQIPGLGILGGKTGHSRGWRQGKMSRL